MFDRKYLRESALWIAAFIFTLEGASWVAARFEPGSPLRFVALTPFVPVLGAGLWVELRQVARMDEFQRLIYLTATLTGSMCAVLFCSVATLGEVLQLWPRVSPVYGLSALFVGFALGWIGAKRRYG